MTHVKSLVGLAATAVLLATACGGGGGGTPLTCNPTLTPTGCSGDYQCEVVAGATSGALGRCFPPAYLDVSVLDPTDGDQPVGGARVIVLDADTGAAAAPAGTTSSSGVARIAVVWPRSDPDLNPAHSFTIRVSAARYSVLRQQAGDSAGLISSPPATCRPNARRVQPAARSWTTR